MQEGMGMVVQRGKAVSERMIRDWVNSLKIESRGLLHGLNVGRKSK